MMAEENLYFPVFINLKGKKIVVIGAGNIAARRIMSLLDFGCDITVIALDCCENIKRLYDEGRIMFEKRAYDAADTEGAFFVLAATDDHDLNKKIHDDCKRKGIVVNVSTDKSLCDFYFPGIVKRKSLVVGFSSSGKTHKKAKLIRQAAEEAIDRVLEEDDK